MSTIFNQVFDALKTYSTEILEEFDEPLPDEGAYNRIIENVLLEAVANIQEDVREYNTTMYDDELNSTVELIEIEEFE